jgi:hypothetical protein
MTENISKRSQCKIKSIKYKDQQIEILSKIYNIIGLDENKRSFYTHEIEYDENKRKEIEDLHEDITNYFSSSYWYCSNNKKKVNKLYISLIRNILKKMSIKYNSQSCKIKINNKYINSTQYTLL